MNNNRDRFDGQSPDRTPRAVARVEQSLNGPDRSAAFYRKRAADVRSVGKASENIAEIALSAFEDLGSEGIDLGTRLAEHLRECAREAYWTACQLDVWEQEARERDDVGRLDEIRASAPVIVLADVRDGAA